MTLVFMIALANRLPDSTRKPASATNGWSKQRMTLASAITASRQLSPMLRPLAVTASSWTNPAPINCATTAGTPPAW